MEKLKIKRWMLTASAVMILFNATGCSIKRDKCQTNHLNQNKMDFAHSYLCENGVDYINGKDFRSAIREQFFGSHNLVTTEQFLEEHGHATPLDYEKIFSKVQKKAKEKRGSINEKALGEICEIYNNDSILVFLDYIIASEGKKQGKYFSKEDNGKIAELFSSNINENVSMYELENKTHSFNLEIEYSGDKLDEYERITELVKSENFDCNKKEEIRGTSSTRPNERSYNVKQTYQITFYNEVLSYGDEENIVLNLNNDWEIANKKKMNEETQCENYSGTLSLKYNNETIKAPVTEEQYEKLADVIAIAVNNNNTRNEFLKESNEILTEVLGDSYQSWGIGQDKVFRKGVK